MSKKLILAAQNELVRKSPEETNIALGTFGMYHCTTLIISNKAGYTSLTHITKNTDISFISDEIQKISPDGIKFYIVRKKLLDELFNPIIEESLKKITNNIEKYLKTNFPNIKSSSIIKKAIELDDLYSDGVIFINKEIHSTSNRAITIFHAMHKQQISIEDALELARPYHIEQLQFLLDYCDDIDFGPKDFQIRIYTSAMFGFFKPNALQKPDIAYSDQSWTTEFTQLTDDKVITNYLDRLHQYKNDLIPEIKKIFFEITQTDLDSYSYFHSETFRYKESLPEQLNNYWNYLAEHEQLSSNRDKEATSDNHDEL